MNGRVETADQLRLAALARPKFSSHALLRARELGYRPDDIYRCVANFEQRYPGSPAHGEGRQVYQRGDIAVVLHEASRTVVTVLPRTTQQWTHGVDTRYTLALG